jgi:hypothetical protein
MAAPALQSLHYFLIAHKLISLFLSQVQRQQGGTKTLQRVSEESLQPAARVASDSPAFEAGRRA